jgi:hypothetical protein
VGQDRVQNRFPSALEAILGKTITYLVKAGATKFQLMQPRSGSGRLEAALSSSGPGLGFVGNPE